MDLNIFYLAKTAYFPVDVMREKFTYLFSLFRWL